MQTHRGRAAGRRARGEGVMESAEARDRLARLAGAVSSARDVTLDWRQTITLARELLIARRLLGEECLTSVRKHTRANQLILEVYEADASDRDYTVTIFHDGAVARTRAVGAGATDEALLAAIDVPT